MKPVQSPFAALLCAFKVGSGSVFKARGEEVGVKARLAAMRDR